MLAPPAAREGAFAFSTRSEEGADNESWEAAMATDGHRATLVYAARGFGKIEGLGQPVRLAPSVLAVLHVHHPVIVRAEEGAPLAVYVVHFLP